jgi:uncharacterized membrane protein YfcA
VGISGPIVVTWIHSYRLPREAHILSVTGIFFFVGISQLVGLGVSGRLNDRLAAAMLAIVPMLVMIPVGTRLRDRLSGRAFDLAVLAVLTVSVTALLIRTFA